MSPSSLMSFSSPSYFPTNNCCFASLCLVPQPVRPVPKSCWAYTRSRSLLLLDSFRVPLPFPPTCTSFPCSFPYPVLLVFPMFVPHFHSQSPSCWACPLQVSPPAYFLPFIFPSRTSLCMWILPIISAAHQLLV